MAWSVPCPECGTQNEPDGSGAVLCSRCGFFYRASTPGPGARTSAPTPSTPAYGGMGEIEAHLTELGIAFQRVSETSIQVVRQIGPQTVHVTIDSARTIHVVSAEGVKNLSFADSAGTRLRFDPDWKERYDFDLALEDKTFALMNAANDGELGDVPDDLPTPPLPAREVTDTSTTQKVLPAVDPSAPAPLPVTKPSLPPTPVPVLGFQKPASQPLGMQRVPSAPLGIARTPSSPTVPSQKPAQIAASMLEALRSVPEDEPKSLAEISAMLPKRPDPPPSSADLSEPPTHDEPYPRAALGRVDEATLPSVIVPITPDGRPPVLTPVRARDDDAPLLVPSVILPSTPDGKPPVLAPAGEGEAPPAPAWRSSTPVPPPLGAEPPRPSGRVHIGNGVSRDVIDTPIVTRAEQAPDAAPEDVEPAPEELPALEPTAETRSEDSSVVVTEPAMAPYRPSGERRQPSSAERPPPPVLHRFGEPAVADDTTRSPIAPRAMAARARRSGIVWAALLGLAIGAAAGLQVAAPGPVAGLFPPTAASEVRAGAQSAREGDVDGALAHFRKAAELDPKWAPAWRNLGVTYALKGDQVQSAAAYRKYLELEQDPELARQVRALLGEK